MMNSDNMSKRISVVVPDDIGEALENWAKQENRSVSNLVATLATQAVKERQEEEISSKGKK